MTTGFHIRDGRAGDLDAIHALYRVALAGEDLSALLSELLAGRADVVSLVATSGKTLVGHIAFTACAIEGCKTRVALLGPLAVLPERQRAGIGRALIGEGCNRLTAGALGKVVRMLVFGDPRYYRRHGFATETAITTPYPIPSEWRIAWQSLPLGDEATPCRGQLIVPTPWMRAGLWSP